MYRKYFVFFLLVILHGHLLASDSLPSIIPAPVSVTLQNGKILVSKKLSYFITSKSQSLSFELNDLSSYLAKNYGIILDKSKNITGANIVVDIKSQLPDIKENKEGYVIRIHGNKIHIEAITSQGVFYAFQTFKQLLPSERLNDQNWPVKLNEMTIVDYPRFEWRGLMLDVSRHFFTKDEVKNYIDQMANFKFNIFHWHLTDDNGWRVEIKQLPKLTEVGAWRVPRTGLWHSFSLAKQNEKPTYGGYYTQDDIKDVIAYAAQRHISILPEIDVPGHSMALLACYPGLSATKMKVNVDPGTKFYKHLDNVLSPANDSVYLLLDKIIGEIAQLFPSPYIHIGGDEAYKGFWENDPVCQAFMKKEHMKDGEELQSYFIKKVQKIIQSKGKKMIGWDEILQGGLASDAVVMSWRGMAGGIQAAKMNHKVIMTPWDYVYLDLYQGDPTLEPPTYGMCRLKDSYMYEPVPDSINESLIMGGQGNLWTESVPTLRHAEYMTWPRSLALSEVYWTPRKNKDWISFSHRVTRQFNRFDNMQINYSKAIYDPIVTPQLNQDSSLTFTLDSEFPDVSIYYTFDGTDPDSYTTKYDGSKLFFPDESTILKVITYKDGKPFGKLLKLNKNDLTIRALAQRHVY